MCNIKSVIELDYIPNEYIEILSNWFYNWWGKNESWSYEKVYNYVKNSTSKKSIPKTFIYVEDGTLKGVCMVSFHDADVRPDIYPWLINVYVDKPYRLQGIGKTLISYAIDYLSKNNYKEVYVYTLIKTLYEKFNFKKIDEIKTFDDDLTYDLLKLEIA